MQLFGIALENWAKNMIKEKNITLTENERLYWAKREIKETLTKLADAESRRKEVDDNCISLLEKLDKQLAALFNE